MKAIILSVLFFTICTAIACCKKTTNKPVKIVRDCTGTYLRYNNEDYHICNTEKTDAFANGLLVTASFTRIDACTGTAQNAIVCEMLHPSVDWITVSDIY
jgi:hypothetical protein